MKLSLSQAAKETGKDKSTIRRAIDKGKLSAEKNVHGHYEVDPAELFRVYPPKHATEQGVDTEATPRNAPGRIDATPHRATGGQGVDASTLALRDQAIEHLQERIGWLEEERERERQQAQAEIDRLVERIEAESEERRIYYRLLTDERKHKPSGFFGLFRSKPAA